MKFEKLILHKYIPLLHSDTTTLSIDMLSSVIPIIGNNGSGKSSVLRMMTVFPPQSSDFEDEGYKELYVSHEGNEYILRSEFTKSKGIHKFIFNGENLNLSENSTAQISLCESHFGMNNLVRDLTSGNMNLSATTRAARKDILLACYPSDLTFVLNYHKKVSSKLRSIKSNIKMMKVRLQEVTDKLMDEEEYKSLTKLDKELVEFQANIDSWMYRLNQDIELLKQHDDYNPDLKDFDKEEFDIRTEILKKDLRSIPNDIMFGTPDVISKVGIIESSMTMRESTLNDLNTQIKKLIKEIDEYEDLDNDDIDSEIKKTRLEIQGLEDTCNEIKIDTNLPVINLPNDHDTILINMNEHITALFSCESRILPSRVISERESDLVNINREGASLASDVDRLKKNANLIRDKIKKQKVLTPDKSCNLKCPLRTNFDYTISGLEKELLDLERTIRVHEKSLETLRDKKNNLITEISPSRQLLGSIQYMENFYNANSWCACISDSLDAFIDSLSDNASKVYNTIARVYANSRAIANVEKIQKDLKSVKYRLKVLLENKLPTKQLISKGLVGKRSELKELQDKFKVFDREYKVLDKQLVNYKKLSKIRSSFKDFADETMARVNSDSITQRISYLQGLIGSLKEYKQAASNKQSGIASTLKEQSHLRIRLNEEINPNLKKLRNDKSNLDMLEAALSPNTGIPHIYMTRFINSIFRTANEYISIVWNYDLSFKELSEDKTLDFNFPITLHNKSGVKDLSMCSKGEQEMLNLAFTLALCVHMSLCNKFPMKLDEVDSGFAATHRGNLLTLLSMLIRQGLIRQLILVNHFSSLFTSFANSQVVCLNPEGIAVPTSYNEGVTIT